MARASRRWPWVISGIVAAAMVAIGLSLPTFAAGGLLHPFRRTVEGPPPAGCREEVFSGEGVRLEGWRCSAPNPARGTVVYLHGVADNRGSARGLIKRLGGSGLDILAYDSRAHGASGGTACTYGYHEKQDLRRVIDTIAHPPVVLVGTSMGAAVALQEAADDPSVAGLVVAEVFSDLETVARERAPAFLSRTSVDKAFRLAEAQGAFDVAAVSPVFAASRVHVPVLLIHGANDRETPPDHSRRVFAALAGPKTFLLVEGAGHNQSLRGEAVWRDVLAFIDRAVADGPWDRAVTIVEEPNERRNQGSRGRGPRSGADPLAGPAASPPRAKRRGPAGAAADHPGEAGPPGS